MSAAETARWRPFTEATDVELRGIRAVCFDVDDTFSSEGRITDEAFSALWALRRAGFVLVPVTGRPAGWCDHFARFWPVDAVVGENGAFTFFMQDGVRRRCDTPMGMAREEAEQRLAALRAQILARFPHAIWSSDQHYREYDLAIDVNEDVPPWPREDVDELLNLCQRSGALARLSSVHVNTWFGRYDKVGGFLHWLGEGAPGAPEVVPEDQWLYLGDSPNDEPMFGHFACSVGVANVVPFRDRMVTGPRWVASHDAGAGFAEVARRLVALRG